MDHGFHVKDGRLIDANGNDFVMRGINHPHTWFLSETGSFADIAATGANTIRVVLSSGDYVQANGNQWTANTAQNVGQVIDLCIDNELVCVLEVHDTTGYNPIQGTSGNIPASLDQAVDYWISIKQELVGKEANVIINIGNEPYGNVCVRPYPGVCSDETGWLSDTQNAITRMRKAGFNHTLMVDAPHWGSDKMDVMQDTATSIFDADTEKNTIFSVHMLSLIHI